jgi:CelD/BcsL family acetyltransferase involved in cellulose biosynthesis
LKLEVFDKPDVFAVLQAEWNDLVQRSTANRIFSTWEWQSTWWEAYQPGQLWVITCRDANNHLIGLAPWFVTGEAPQRIVATIGCKEVTDYLDLIVDIQHVEPVLEQFASFLVEQRARYDRMELCNIPEDGISRTNWPGILEDCGFAVSIEPEDVCPVVSLPQDWTGYLELLDKKQRHELRRKLRRATGNNASIDWYIVSSEHNLDEEMQYFFAMMAASDPDKAVFLADPLNKAFFTAITQVMLAAGWLQLSFLTINGERAATYLNFDYNEQILVYNSGLLQDDYGHFSPGILLLAYNIQHAIETHHTTFDFLQGDEEYKYRMGGQDVGVFNLIAEHKGA